MIRNAIDQYNAYNVVYWFFTPIGYAKILARGTADPYSLCAQCTKIFVLFTEKTICHIFLFVYFYKKKSQFLFIFVICLRSPPKQFVTRCCYSHIRPIQLLLPCVIFYVSWIPIHAYTCIRVHWPLYFLVPDKNKDKDLGGRGQHRSMEIRWKLVRA